MLNIFVGNVNQFSFQTWLKNIENAPVNRNSSFIAVRIGPIGDEGLKKCQTSKSNYEKSYAYTLEK